LDTYDRRLAEIAIISAFMTGIGPITKNFSRRLVKHHGVREEGWESARWEVYDTVGFRPASSLLMLIFAVCAVRGMGQRD
jgi:hypothetical protein